MLDTAFVSDWLNRYVAAWKSYNPAGIGALFAENAVYYYHPFDEPVVGREAIVQWWLEEPDAPGTYDATYRPIMIDGRRAVTNGRSRYYDADGTILRAEFDNIFILTFNDAGECSEFREWYMQNE